MARRYGNISFLTDYGTVDEFVGVVHAVIADLAPHARVIDLTHQIPAHDVRAGALALVRAVQYLPSGVVLAVVDPGVGTARKAIAVEVAGGEAVFVGPDNGLLAPAIAMCGGGERAVLLTNPGFQLPAPGVTFAGRDVFAPADAHLCNGVDLAELGEPVDPGVLLPGIVPLPRPEAGSIVCEILWVDRFGNCQLNVGPEDVDGWGDRVRLRYADTTRAATVSATYGTIGGGIGLVVDSYGMLSVCLDRRSAADELGLAVGDAVTLARLDGDHGDEGTAGDGGISVRLGPPTRR
ncbi:MAG: S-adenosyl-l-methionine hydroxide adenosyltransferase family protein [Acidimicrobiales bacterium]